MRTPLPGGHAGLSCWGRRWIGDLLVKPTEVWATASQKCLSRWLRSAQHLRHHFYLWMEYYWGLFFHGRSEGTQLLICDPSHGSEGEGLTSSGVKHYDRNGFSEVWFSTTRGMVEVLLQCRSWSVSLHRRESTARTWSLYSTVEYHTITHRLDCQSSMVGAAGT